MAKEEAEIKELSKKLAQQPDSMVFVQLADAYRRAGDLEQSNQVCLQGLERHPTYTTARAILGRNYLDLGKLDEAVNEFRQIEVSDPENIMAHRMLGQIFLQKGQYAEAITRQQRVLALDPDDTTAQELLQDALKRAKQQEGGVKPPPAAPAPAAASAEQLQTLKVADIYIKKGALDEAAEVLQEVLAADPSNALARQKLQEVDQRRGKGAAADDEAKAKAQAEAKRQADEEAKAKAQAEAKRQADEEAKAKAQAEAKRQADEEAKAKAEAEAKRQADEEAKAKAEADAKRQADEEAKAKAEAEAKRQADEEAKAKAEAHAKRQADEEAKAKAQAEAKRQAEEERKAKEAGKLSSEDILAVMTGSSDELISDEPAARPAAPVAAPGLDAGVGAILDEFIQAQGIEAGLLLGPGGGLLKSYGSHDAGSWGATAWAIFGNTEKAAGRMSFGGLKQIMIVGEDGRQILFVALKAGVLVALTGRNTNLGLLRVGVNDLVKRA
jgi:predicted regulator of Ras-like GTPase activity (Roadblock/LC7/MglB family)/Flp pilus assembly protein TadD